MFGINAYSKKNLLKRKLEVTQGMIIQKEIDIDVYWRLLDLKQKEKDTLLKKILEAEALYKAELAKDFYEGKAAKVEELKQKAIDLGWTGREQKSGQPVYEGEIVKAESAIEHFLMEIRESVMNREFVKLQLICIKQLIKSPYDPVVEAFKNVKLKELTDE